MKMTKTEWQKKKDAEMQMNIKKCKGVKFKLKPENVYVVGNLKKRRGIGEGGGGENICDKKNRDACIGVTHKKKYSYLLFGGDEKGAYGLAFNTMMWIQFKPREKTYCELLDLYNNFGKYQEKATLMIGKGFQRGGLLPDD